MQLLLLAALIAASAAAIVRSYRAPRSFFGRRRSVLALILASEALLLVLATIATSRPDAPLSRALRRVVWGPEGTTRGLVENTLAWVDPSCCSEGECEPSARSSAQSDLDRKETTPQGPADVEGVLDAFRRLAAKKGRKQLVGWQLLVEWHGERLSGRLAPERHRV